MTFHRNCYHILSWKKVTNFLLFVRGGMSIQKCGNMRTLWLESLLVVPSLLYWLFSRHQMTEQFLLHAKAESRREWQSLHIWNHGLLPFPRSRKKCTLQKVFMISAFAFFCQYECSHNFETPTHCGPFMKMFIELMITADTRGAFWSKFKRKT